MCLIAKQLPLNHALLQLQFSEEMKFQNFSPLMSLVADHMPSVQRLWLLSERGVWGEGKKEGKGKPWREGGGVEGEEERANPPLGAQCLAWKEKSPMPWL